jgi:hypothetical protein
MKLTYHIHRHREKRQLTCSFPYSFDRILYSYAEKEEVMKTFCSLSIITAIVLSLSSLLAGCGGGGVDTSRAGGTDASLTASSAGQVGDTVAQAVKLVAPAAAVGEVKTASVSSGEKPPLIHIFETVAPVVRGQNNGRLSNALHTEACPNGGTIEVGSLSPVDFTHTKAEVNVNSCKQGSATLNGPLEVTFPTSALADPQHVEEFTITTPNFTYSDVATNDNITLSGDFAMIFQNITYNGNSLTGGSITMGGVISGMIDGNPINVECDSFGLLFNSDPSGIAVSVSGRIKAACLGGWVTMSTNSSVFLPPSAHCPTKGDVAVSAGANTVTVTIAADSRITVLFNNAVVQTFDSCDQVRGLCSS